ncbi:MAG: hypothetical protein J1D86_03475 [Alistipes sp.]|nr:hypothetical protein [Alistipes sp.]
MGLLNKINNALDSLKSADFEVSSTMKVNALCTAFKKKFDLSLRVYKGKQLADGRMTLNTLDQRTSMTVKTGAMALTIKANQKVGDVEEAFRKQFGITVQIANFDNTKLLDNNLTLGEARRAGK